MFTARPILVVLIPLVLVGLLVFVEEPRTRGRVVDSCKRPLSGAIVRWQTTPVATFTDREGYFALARLPQGSRLTAARPGYLIAGITPDRSTAVEIVLRPLPEGDCGSYAWVDAGPERGQSGNCASCHGELYREWRASAHARSATGMHFRNLYDGTDRHGRPGVGWGVLTQNDLAAGVCVSCHAPSVREDDAGVLDMRHLGASAAQGVHCDYCHKVEDLRGPIDGLNHGRFGLKVRRPEGAPDEQLFFGPLDDVDRGEDTFAPIHRDSRFCAACHEGTVFGVPVYTTYSEWRASPAGRLGVSCQACHLRPTGTLTNVAPGRGGKERDPRTLANHRFLVGDLPTMLRGSVHLSGSMRADADGFTVTVVVAAEQVGHRVPTGYVDRHVILVAEGRDARGVVIEPLSGPRLAAPAGSLAGRPGWLFGRLLTDPDGTQPAPFWTSRREVIDTRLYPERPERFTWRFPASAQSVQTKLVYRRFWEEVAVLKNWPSIETVIAVRSLSAGPTGPN